MVEYGVKKLITNPTLITNATNIVKVIDARSKKTKAFVVPAKYKKLIDRLIKEIEHQNWAKEKRDLLDKPSMEDLDMDKGIERASWESIEEYLDD